MGHFGKVPIRLAWYGLVFPSLTLNYLGQGALVLRDPAAARNPFYLLAPEPLLFPMVVLATCATIIASQATISAAYSVTQQASRLNFLPRLRVLHTSDTAQGQIYVPLVNWLMLAGVLSLVVGFGSSGCPRRRVWHRRKRRHDHQHVPAHRRRPQPTGADARSDARGARRIPGCRVHLPELESHQDRGWRLVPARAGERAFRGAQHLAARRRTAAGEEAKRSPRRGPAMCARVRRRRCACRVPVCSSARVMPATRVRSFTISSTTWWSTSACSSFASISWTRPTSTIPSGWISSAWMPDMAAHRPLRLPRRAQYRQDPRARKYARPQARCRDHVVLHEQGGRRFGYEAARTRDAPEAFRVDVAELAERRGLPWPSPASSRGS